jgi:hypothetical protein
MALRRRVLSDGRGGGLRFALRATTVNGMDYDWLPIAVAITVASLALNYDARRERARYRDGQIRFRPGIFLRVAAYLGLLLPMLAVVDMVVHQRYAEMLPQWPLFTVVAGVFVAIGYGCPRTISVDNSSVRPSGYFGPGAKKILWEGAHAVAEPNMGRYSSAGQAASR